MYIIETATLIPTKFCYVIKTTKYSSWVVQHVYKKSKMADGRHIE